MHSGTIVGILRGGPHAAHLQSLESGRAALLALQALGDQFVVRDIYIDAAGVWHERGRAVEPVQVLPHLDLALVLASGSYAATGTLQRLLEKFGIPYSGTRPHQAFEATHSLIAREGARTLGIAVPRYYHVDSLEQVHSTAAEASRSLLSPLVVHAASVHARQRPDTQAQIVTGYHPVHQAVTGMLAAGTGGAIIEERVRGPRVQVSIIENIRGESHYAPPGMVLPDPFAQREQGQAPVTVSRDLLEEAAALAKQLHNAFDLRHHSESLFAVSPRGLVFLEINPFPHLGDSSAFATACSSTGIRGGELFPHLVALALADKNR